MDTKLTLRLDQKIIEKAKLYAREHKVSLSKIIEHYLESITKQSTKENSNDESEITPLVKSLSGVISLAEDFDYKKEYRDYINEKYK